MRGQPGFFDVDDWLKRLSDLGDHLDAFNSAVDSEMFDANLVGSSGLFQQRAGRPHAFDPVRMFKILAIQAMHNLSERTR